MKRAALLLSIAMLSACVAPPKSHRAPPVPATAKAPAPAPAPAKGLRVTLTPEQEEAAKKAVQDKLKDPYTAVFDGMYGSANPENPQSVVACGTVNAKNSYGGYTGRTPFAVVKGNAYLWSSAKSGFPRIDNDVINILCATAPAKP